MNTWKPVVSRKKYKVGGLVQDRIESGIGPTHENTVGYADPAKKYQSALEASQREAKWRKGHKLSGSQKERIAAEAGELAGLKAQADLFVAGTQEPVAQPQQAVAQSQEAVNLDADPADALDADPADALDVTEPAQPSSLFGSLSSLQSGFKPRSFQQGKLGTSMLPRGLTLGMRRGGTIDYRNGGPVSGPPGRDTVPVVNHSGGPTEAMVDNGEYVLPRKTVKQIGKSELDELVVRTTGEKPVGYAGGGFFDRFRNRDKQIDEAVKKALEGPPKQPELPKNTSKSTRMRDIMREIRKKNPPQGTVQKYQEGGIIRPRTPEGLQQARNEARAKAQAELRARQAATAKEAAARQAAPKTGFWDKPRKGLRVGGKGLLSKGLLSKVGSVAKQPLIVAPAIGGAIAAWESATDPQAVADFRERVAGGDQRTWLGDLGADTLRTFRHIGDAATFGGASYLGQGISNLVQGRDSSNPAVNPEELARQLETPTGVPKAEARGDAQEEGLSDVASIKSPAPQESFIRRAGPQDKSPITDEMVSAEMVANPDKYQRNALGIDGPTMARANLYSRGPGAEAFSDENVAQARADAQAFETSKTAQQARTVDDINADTEALRDLRRVRTNLADGRPADYRKPGIAGVAAPPLSVSEQISLANLGRGFAKDQRAGEQNKFSNRLSISREEREQAKALNAQRDRFMERADELMPEIAEQAPWMQESAAGFFQQAADANLANPRQAMNLLMGAQKELAKRTEEVLFKYSTPDGGTIDITGAQAIAILNGDTPLGGWFSGMTDEVYDAIRQQAAAVVQEAALAELAQ